MTIAPQVIPGLAKLADSAAANTASLMREAYEMGREDMRRELMALLSPSRAIDPARTTVVLDTAVLAQTKAPPGTVRPAILRMIEQSPGVSTDRILVATGFKENSVRGTLSTLAKEGKIKRDLRGWITTNYDALIEEAVMASKSSEPGSEAPAPRNGGSRPLTSLTEANPEGR
jgi:hypothetical protein